MTSPNEPVEIIPPQKNRNRQMNYQMNAIKPPFVPKTSKSDRLGWQDKFSYNPGFAGLKTIQPGIIRVNWVNYKGLTSIEKNGEPIHRRERFRHPQKKAKE
jgi:hypothetical protein